jgi:hypothetical protein
MLELSGTHDQRHFPWFEIHFVSCSIFGTGHAFPSGSHLFIQGLKPLLDMIDFLHIFFSHIHKASL